MIEVPHYDTSLRMRLVLFPATSLTAHWTQPVIQELLVNMKKHSKCSLVVLTFKQSEKKLQIDYTDNGIGATIEQLNSKNGLQNIENRIQAIKGIITFDTKSEKGFKVHFMFPI